MKSRIILKIISVLALLAIPFTCFGISEIKYIGEENQSFNIVIPIFITKGDDSLNAIEGEIHFDKSLIFKNAKFGNSSINFWVEKPHISSPGVLTFSGISPGGLLFDQNLLFEALFEAKDENQYSFEFKSVRGLTAEGVESKIRSNNFFVNSKKDMTIGQTKKDSIPPERFQIYIYYDDMYERGMYAAFNAIDKGTGVSYYEAKEGVFSKYQKTESPYKLQGKIIRRVFVKAVDFDGNQRVESKSPRATVLDYEDSGKIIITTSVFLILFLFLWIFLFQKKS